LRGIICALTTHSFYLWRIVLPEIENLNQFVKWFRYSSPYINAHRGKTFVVLFDGDAVEDDNFSHLIHDFALLNSLGIKLVLVHGARPQIERQLEHAGNETKIVNNIRVTDEQDLQCVKQAVGEVRINIEAMLSMGVINSPMAGANIRVSSGNFIIAKPLGVVEGVDYCFTGEVRRIDYKSIHKQLDDGTIVLLSSLGYSTTGEVFNLTAEEVALQTAINIGADKFIYLTKKTPLADSSGKIIKQMTLSEAKEYLKSHVQLSQTEQHNLACAIDMTNKGVKRVHLIDHQTEGALLLELFSRNGIGTLITTDCYDIIREANIDDVGGILELIEPLEAQDILVRRSRERLEIDIPQFTVMERDGMIIGCAALHHYANENITELSCLAIHDDYQNEKRGETLLSLAEKHALKSGSNSLFVLTVKTAHWFIENGFSETSIDALPVDRKTIYNYHRKSKVLMKKLSSNDI